MTLKFLLEKEFKQFFRNPMMPKMALFFPLVVMFIMPWATSMDIKNMKVVVVDHDRSPMSTEFVQKMGNSTYFNISSFENTYPEALEQVEYGDADLVLEIPRGFESDLVTTGTAPLNVSVNAVNSIKGMLGYFYVGNFTMEYSAGLAELRTIESSLPQPKVDVVVKNMYNPTLNYKNAAIPGLMMIILIVLCAFLPSVNIVMEKEKGTIEQMNVTPVSKWAFILAKLIPFWLIGFVALTMAFIVAWALYGLLPAGSFLTMYLFAGLFIFTITGAGLVVSNHSSTMQQATFVMFFFVIISILMCGLLTPVASMPGWAQTIAALTPTKYMVNVFISVYMKGSTISDLWLDLVALTLLMIAFNVWAVRSYKKSQ